MSNSAPLSLAPLVPEALSGMAVRTRFALATYRGSGGEERLERVRANLRAVGDLAHESGLHELARALSRFDEVLSNQDFTEGHYRAIDIALRDIADQRHRLRMAPALFQQGQPGPAAQASPLELILQATEHAAAVSPEPSPHVPTPRQSDIRELAPRTAESRPEGAMADLLAAVLLGTDVPSPSMPAVDDADTDVDDAPAFEDAIEPSVPTLPRPMLPPRAAVAPVLPLSLSPPAPAPALTLSLSPPSPVTLTPPAPPKTVSAREILAAPLPVPQMLPLAAGDDRARAVVGSTNGPAAAPAFVSAETAERVRAGKLDESFFVPFAQASRPSSAPADDDEDASKPEKSKGMVKATYVVAVALLGLLLGLFARVLVTALPAAAAPPQLPPSVEIHSP